MERSMGGRLFWYWVLILSGTTIPVDCTYYSTTLRPCCTTEKLTTLHFFYHDTFKGLKPSSVMVAHAKPSTADHKSLLPFSSVFVADAPLTEGPEPTTMVIGNAQGLYVSSGEDQLMVTTFLDYGFTAGAFNGSSISVFSRNPAMEVERELAVVGGRGKFRMARGFAKLRTHVFNMTSGVALVEYRVTVMHY